MSRSKPRYPLQLDAAFVAVAEHWGIAPFELEMCLAAVCALSTLGDNVGIMNRDMVEHMLQRLTLKHPEMPTFTLAVQGGLPF